MTFPRLTLSLVAGLGALAAAACHDQQTIEGTSSRTLNVAGKRLKANLTPTGTPNEFDLLIVRDAVVIDPDPASERARGEEAAARVTREVCQVRRLNPQIVSERLVSEINYYVRFRCA
ncbi:MAG: hypothetical protein FD144_4246 [Rhodospirillaceae bacterium]|nr:MAG: hypothetical protein FD144_4246 [Rhodospirillaceae bacterium]